MLRAARRLAAIGMGVALATALGGPAAGAPAAAPARGRPAAPRAYLIHLIDGGDPIVVEKYTEEDGQVVFEKYGGLVAIPRYEVLRIVPDTSDDTTAGTLPAPTPVETPAAPLYVATRSGATMRATDVGETGSRVRVSTPEGSLTFHRADLVGVLRVPAPPAVPEAWITLFGFEDGSSGPGQPTPGPESAPRTPPPALTDRPHLLQLANGVVVQVEGFWVEGGEIRFRRLGGVVGFALGEIARFLPQEVEEVRGRLTARFVRRLGPGRLEVRLGEELRRVRLVGIEPLSGERALEDPWATVERGLLVQLEFDRQRYDSDGDWLAYVYLPSGRMLNAELIRVGLARPRPEVYNVRYLDLFQDLVLSRRPSDPN
jgi:nuclease-like protein